MITNEFLDNMWEDTTSTTKATNVETTKKLLRDVVFTMACISKLDADKTYITVVMEASKVVDGQPVPAETERFGLNDYVIDPAFKMFVVPREVKIEANPMWKNLKSKVVDSIVINDATMLTPDAFTRAQLLILASVGKKFSPSIRMGDATIAMPLSSVKAFVVDGRVYSYDKSVSDIPIFFESDFEKFIDIEFIPTMSKKAYSDKIKMNFISIFSSWNGGTNKNKGKTTFKPKGNKSKPKSSSSNDTKSERGADSDAPNGETDS